MGGYIKEDSMSKYKRAYERLNSVIYTSYWSEHLYKSNWGEYLSTCEDSFEMEYQMDKDLEVVKEAVDKGTPVKRVSNGVVDFCGSCKGTLWQIQVESNYCFRCGQRIDWDMDIRREDK